MFGVDVGCSILILARAMFVILLAFVFVVAEPVVVKVTVVEGMVA
jgi:hypothetical protein